MSLYLLELFFKGLLLEFDFLLEPVGLGLEESLAAAAAGAAFDGGLVGLGFLGCGDWEEPFFFFNEALG